jgi:hypothetical protein
MNESDFQNEKETSKHWSKFLFDLYAQKLTNVILTKKEYKPEFFGCWVIEREAKRIFCQTNIL